jgi:hypothetical protein
MSSGPGFKFMSSINMANSMEGSLEQIEIAKSNWHSAAAKNVYDAPNVKGPPPEWTGTSYAERFCRSMDQRLIKTCISCIFFILSDEALVPITCTMRPVLLLTLCQYLQRLLAFLKLISCTPRRPSTARLCSSALRQALASMMLSYHVSP